MNRRIIAARGGRRAVRHARRRENQWPGSRRGAIGIAVVGAMILASLVVVATLSLTAQDQDLTLLRVESTRAFYACEAGMNMAVREIYINVDADGDGAIGTISNDANAANDPDLSGGRVSVSKVTAGTTTLTSQGRAGQAVREAQAVIE